MEFETAVRLKLHPSVLILNDNGFGMIKCKQQSSHFADFRLDFDTPLLRQNTPQPIVRG